MKEKTLRWPQSRSGVLILGLLLLLTAWWLWSVPVSLASEQCQEGGEQCAEGNTVQLPDFTISAEPASQTVTRGQTATYLVNLNTINCYTGTVTLSVAGLPENVTFVFDPDVLELPGESAFTIATTADTPTGTHPLTISGDSGGLHHETVVDLVVNATTEPDFSIAVSPASQPVDPGGEAAYTVSLGALDGFSDTVSLAVTGLPTGTNAVFAPDALVPPGDSVLTVTTETGTSPGTYGLTISGQGGGQYHEAGVDLVVNEPSGQATVSVSPAADEILVGETAQSQILLSDAANFYGIEFSLTFDPSVLQVVDADPETDGVQIGLGDLFPPDQYVVGENQVFTDTGLINFGVARRAPAPPVDGGGVLAVITWEAVGEGSSPLDFTHLKLADPSGFELAATSQGGLISVIQTGHLSGTVHMQGREDHSGVEVELLPAGLTVTTDAGGLFSFTAFGTLTVTARIPGYLVAQTAVEVAPGGSVDLGVATLYGGEVTGDDLIDIGDLAYLGARFHGDDLSADVNADGRVDILDLVMAAANFMMSGPTPWSE